MNPLTNNFAKLVSTNALTNGTFYFSDPKCTNYTARFYPCQNTVRIEYRPNQLWTSNDCTLESHDGC